MTELVVRYGYEEDLDAIRRLDNRVFSSEWLMGSDFWERLFHRNPYVYRVADEAGEVKGYSCMIPLEKEIYDLVLEGVIDQEELCDVALSYEDSKEVYIYFFSMAVDVYSDNRKLYSKSLIVDILDSVEEIENMGVEIKEFGMIAVSEEGNRASQSVGYHFSGTVDLYGETYNVYKGTVEDIRGCILI